MQQYRKRKFKETNVRVLTVTDDMSHLFSLNSAIDNGEIISLTCDRSAGSEKSIKCNFLGEPAKFPVGPFALATTKNVEVLSLFIMKEKRKNYRIFVKNITVHQENINKKEKIQQLARNYIKELEKVVKLYPTQWFNFYDFGKINFTYMKLTSPQKDIYAKERLTAIQAQRLAQEIAFAPVVFQISRLMVKFGILKLLLENKQDSPFRETERSKLPNMLHKSS